jgi:6-phosphogluconate dehydrogenase
MTKDEAIQEVVDAAQEALKNLIDTGVRASVPPFVIVYPLKYFRKMRKSQV